MKKTITMLLATLYCVLVLAVDGFIPQGKKLANGQMDPKTLINISRTDFIGFLDNNAQIPTGIMADNIYYQPWVTDLVVRKQYSMLLRTELCTKTGMSWQKLCAIMYDSAQTPIRSLLPGDMVRSNGIVKQGRTLAVAPAPKRLARMTVNGMEQYMILPNNVVVYLTCLNIDIADAMGEESIQEIKRDSIVQIINSGTVTINEYHQQVPLKKQPPIVITQITTPDTIVNRYYVTYTQPPRDTVYEYIKQPTVQKKVVVMYYDDCAYCPKPAVKGSITNNCPAGSISNNCPKGSVGWSPRW